MTAASCTVLAADPGLTGALAWLRARADGGIELLSVVDLPTAQAHQGGKVKTHLLPAAILDLIRNPTFSPSHFVLEQVSARPGQGVTSMFRFGHTAGLLEGLAVGAGLPVTHLSPARWMALAGVRKGEDAGRLRAVQLFPEHAFWFARKKDHNRADAALIGYAFLRQRQP